MTLCSVRGSRRAPRPRGPEAAGGPGPPARAGEGAVPLPGYQTALQPALQLSILPFPERGGLWSPRPVWRGERSPLPPPAAEGPAGAPRGRGELRPCKRVPRNLRGTGRAADHAESTGSVPGEGRRGHGGGDAGGAIAWSGGNGQGACETALRTRGNAVPTREPGWGLAFFPALLLTPSPLGGQGAASVQELPATAPARQSIWGGGFGGSGCCKCAAAAR